jgi:hypothetical protein
METLGGEEIVNEHPRMLNFSKPPEPHQVKEWIGSRASVLWAELTEFIESQYPGVFKQDWWFGGKKWGWSLRYKKSKSFCNLIPERGQFKFLLVFGAEERKKVEAILPQLTSHVREDYEKATTFHDGKWVATLADSKKVVADIERLLVLKRKPKNREPESGKTSGGKRRTA